MVLEISYSRSRCDIDRRIIRRRAAETDRMTFTVEHATSMISVHQVNISVTTGERARKV